MPDISIKSFNQLIDSLERISDGVEKHKGDPDFPLVIREEYLRNLKKEIEVLRSSYEETMSQARKLQDEYRQKEVLIKKELARFKTMLYGFYGKRSSVVMDFGMKPFKEKVAKKKSTPTVKVS